MDASPKYRLGHIVFLVRDDGLVARSVVNSVGLEGRFSILEHSYRPAHSMFADARGIALALLKKKEAKAEDVLKSIRAQIELVNSSDYEEAVMKEPYVKSSTTFIGDQKIDAEFPAPATYLEPGTTVYAVITPKTHNMMHPHYRPHPYFVLESKVKDAVLAPNGKIFYHLQSYYAPQDIYPDVDSAKKKLVEVFSTQTGGTLFKQEVKLVTYQEEKSVEAESSRKISEQPRSIKMFDRLSDSN